MGMGRVCRFIIGKVYDPPRCISEFPKSVPQTKPPHSRNLPIVEPREKTIDSIPE